MRYISGLVFICCISVAVAATPQIAAEYPQRIIALAPHITELLYAAGAGEQLIAVSDYSDYPAAALKLPQVASYQGINLEAVLALKPDLIVAWRQGAATSELKRLQQMGVQVVYSDPQTPDDIAAELQQLGELTGHARYATEQAQLLRQQWQQLKTSYSDQTPVRVFFAMDTDLLTTVAGNSMVQQILTLCAAENPFAGQSNDYPRAALEQVLVSQPQLIIQAGSATTPADFSYWQKFEVLPAVRKQQFLAVNADHLYRMTPRTLLAAQTVCEGVDKIRKTSLQAGSD
ncbi:cobalamin-binding protein [Chromatiaceae bacterium AAb-1]|nr:cobalamin-binding protein [Chromatiaceae bacterium AAb-1]